MKLVDRSDTRECIKKAFASLRSKGYIALMNHMCCMNCAMEDMGERVAEAEAKGKEVRGLVYYHGQDNDRFEDTGTLDIRFSGVTISSKEAGKEIVQALKRSGLYTVWAGDPDRTIFVSGLDDKPKTPMMAPVLGIKVGDTLYSPVSQRYYKVEKTGTDSWGIWFNGITAKKLRDLTEERSQPVHVEEPQFSELRFELVKAKTPMLAPEEIVIATHDIIVGGRVWAKEGTELKVVKREEGVMGPGSVTLVNPEGDRTIATAYEVVSKPKTPMLAPTRYCVILALRDEIKGTVYRWSIKDSSGGCITVEAMESITDEHNEEITEIEMKFGVLDIEGYSIGDVYVWGYHSYEIEDWIRVGEKLLELFETHGYFGTRLMNIQADLKTGNCEEKEMLDLTPLFTRPKTPMLAPGTCCMCKKTLGDMTCGLCGSAVCDDCWNDEGLYLEQCQKCGVQMGSWCCVPKVADEGFVCNRCYSKTTPMLSPDAPKKCPKCGHEAWRNVEGQWECQKCNHKFKDKDPMTPYWAPASVIDWTPEDFGDVWDDLWDVTNTKSPDREKGMAMRRKLLSDAHLSVKEGAEGYGWLFQDSLITDEMVDIALHDPEHGEAYRKSWAEARELCEQFQRPQTPMLAPVAGVGVRLQKVLVEFIDELEKRSDVIGKPATDYTYGELTEIDSFWLKILKVAIHDTAAEGYTDAFIEAGQFSAKLDREYESETKRVSDWSKKVRKSFRGIGSIDYWKARKDALIEFHKLFHFLLRREFGFAISRPKTPMLAPEDNEGMWTRPFYNAREHIWMVEWFTIEDDGEYLVYNRTPVVKHADNEKKARLLSERFNMKQHGVKVPPIERPKTPMLAPDYSPIPNYRRCKKCGTVERLKDGVLGCGHEWADAPLTPAEIGGVWNQLADPEIARKQDEERGMAMRERLFIVSRISESADDFHLDWPNLKRSTRFRIVDASKRKECQEVWNEAVDLVFYFWRDRSETPMLAPEEIKKRGVVVCDLDMTIVDDTVRKEQAKKLLLNDWMLAYLSPESLRYDQPVPKAIEALKILSKNYDIVYLTVRPENTREETLRFFKEYGYPEGKLLMHPATILFDGSFKPKEIKRLLSEGMRIRIIYDDEERYINEYHRMGLRAFRVKDLSVWEMILSQLQDATVMEAPKMKDERLYGAMHYKHQATFTATKRGYTISDEAIECLAKQQKAKDALPISELVIAAIEAKKAGFPGTGLFRDGTTAPKETITAEDIEMGYSYIIYPKMESDKKKKEATMVSTSAPTLASPPVEHPLDFVAGR